MFALDEKIAVVTGGSRGIGRAICGALAQAGAYVVVNYNGNEAAAAQTLTSIEGAGGKGEIAQFSVADPEAVETALREIAKRLGRIDILVNNAGISIDQLLLRVTPEHLEKTFSTNVSGAVFCSKVVIRPMMKKRCGRIINISSVVGEMGNPGQAVYSASKAAVIGLTKTLAREYASRGVTVNAVAPGFIATDMTAEMSQEAQEWILTQTPAGRVGTPEEVAAAVLFLASDEAAYVTGQVLRVNGGMYL